MAESSNSEAVVLKKVSSQVLKSATGRRKIVVTLEGELLNEDVRRALEDKLDSGLTIYLAGNLQDHALNTLQIENEALETENHELRLRVGLPPRSR